MLKRKPLKRKPKKFDKEAYDEMWEFFLSVWKTKFPHKCEECGANLGPTPLSYYFDHILEKQKYPFLKYDVDNIQYLCLKCHDEKSRGFYSGRVKQKMKDLQCLRLEITKPSQMEDKQLLSILNKINGQTI